MHSSCARIGSSILLAVAFLGVHGAAAQPLGTFSWQLQAFCNVLTLSVTQSGSILALDGFDDQCGAATRAAATGTAFPNPDGTIGLGIDVVTSPAAEPVHVSASISVATGSGTWTDSLGHSGTLALGANIGGAPRPLSAGFRLGGLPVLSAPGTDNLHVGGGAGSSSTGSNNTFVGDGAGASNTSGSSNTFVGHNARAGSASATNAGAFGAHAQVNTSNAIVLGGVAGVNGATTTARVGIGTSLPTARLDVVSGDSTGILARRVGGVSTITLQRTNESSDVLEGQQIGRIVARVPDPFDPDFAAAGMRFVATQDHESFLTRGTRIDFFTTSTVLGANPVTSMTVDSGGWVGIGTTSPANPLDVNGDIRVGTSGTNGCLRNNNGGAIVGTCASDAPFKRDVVAYSNVLASVASLRPVRFSWRGEAFPDRRFGSDREAGLIAQQVEEVLPELVQTDGDGYKAVDYSKLPLLAIQAIRELKAENDELRTRLEAIEALLASRR